jgi:hypothetical protein
LLFYFFELPYNDNMRGLHCDNSILAYSVPWASSPLHDISTPLSPLPPFSNNVLWVSLCCLHMYICNILPFSLLLTIHQGCLLFLTCKSRMATACRVQRLDFHITFHLERTLFSSSASH